MTSATLRPAFLLSFCQSLADAFGLASVLVLRSLTEAALSDGGSLRAVVEPITATGAAIRSTASLEGRVCLWRVHGQMQSKMVSMQWPLAMVCGCGERGLASVISRDGGHQDNLKITVGMYFLRNYILLSQVGCGCRNLCEDIPERRDLLVLLAETMGIKITIKITVGIYFLRKCILQSRMQVQEHM